MTIEQKVGELTRNYLRQVKELGVLPSIIPSKRGETLVFTYDFEKIDSQTVLKCFDEFCKELPEGIGCCIMPKWEMVQNLTKEQLMTYIENLKILVEVRGDDDT